MEQVRESGFSLPGRWRCGCPYPGGAGWRSVPRRCPCPAVAIEGTNCRNRALGGSRRRRSMAKLCPLKACQTSSRQGAPASPAAVPPKTQGRGSRTPSRPSQHPKGSGMKAAAEPQIQPRAPLYPHCSMLLVNVSAPLPDLPECPTLSHPSPGKGCPRKHLPHPSSSGEARD